MRKGFLALTPAAALAGCAIAPPPAAVVEPVGVIVCDDVPTDPGPVGCYSARYGYWQGLAIGYDANSPAPVAFVAVGLNASGGFGGGTVVRDAAIKNTVVPNAAPRSSFAAAHPGWMAGLRAVGRVARASARIAGKVAVAKAHETH
jgi:hypothetical protein